MQDVPRQDSIPGPQGGGQGDNILMEHLSEVFGSTLGSRAPKAPAQGRARDPWPSPGGWPRAPAGGVLLGLHGQSRLVGLASPCCSA